MEVFHRIFNKFFAYRVQNMISTPFSGTISLFSFNMCYFFFIGVFYNLEICVSETIWFITMSVHLLFTAFFLSFHMSFIGIYYYKMNNYGYKKYVLATVVVTYLYYCFCVQLRYCDFLEEHEMLKAEVVWRPLYTIIQFIIDLYIHRARNYVHPHDGWVDILWQHNDFNKEVYGPYAFVYASIISRMVERHEDMETVVFRGADPDFVGLDKKRARRACSDAAFMTFVWHCGRVEGSPSMFLSLEMEKKRLKCNKAKCFYTMCVYYAQSVAEKMFIPPDSVNVNVIEEPSTFFSQFMIAEHCVELVKMELKEMWYVFWLKYIIPKSSLTARTNQLVDYCADCSVEILETYREVIKKLALAIYKYNSPGKVEGAKILGPAQSRDHTLYNEFVVARDLRRWTDGWTAVHNSMKMQAGRARQVVGKVLKI